MEKSKFRGRGLQLVLSFLVVVGFGFLGGVVGVVLGYFLWLYMIPPWSSVEIDRDGMEIVEIVGDDVIGLGSGKEHDEIEVIIKTVEGDYFSYFEDNWRIFDPAEIDSTRFEYQYSWC